MKAMTQPEVIQYLKSSLKDQVQFTTQELIELLSKANPEANNKTHSWRINQLKTDGLIHQIGRGLYSFDSKPEFIPVLSLKTKRLYNRVVELVPDLELVVWETPLLSDIMNKSIDKHFIFLHTNRNKLDLLHSELMNFSKPSFPNPSNEIIEKYLLPLPEAIILLPLSSQTPIVELNEFKTNTIEGLLVTACTLEPILKPIGIDIQQLFTLAFSKYNVNVSKLLRYAGRRDRKTEIIQILDTIS